MLTNWRRLIEDITANRDTNMNAAGAEIVGIQALGWLIGNDDLSGAFLNMSGLSVDELKTRAGDPEFLGFVLDFLLTDEAALMDFCADYSLPNDSVARARAALPGGDVYNWT